VGAAFVQLGEWVIEEEQRGGAAGVAEGRGLDDAERYGRRALLAGGAEGTEVVAVEDEAEVVPVGANVGDAPLEVGCAGLMERVENRLCRVFRIRELAGVRQHNGAGLADLLGQATDVLSHRGDPARARAHQRGAVLGQERIPGGSGTVVAQTERGAALGEGGAVGLEGLEVGAGGDSQDDVEVAAAFRRGASDQLDIGWREEDAGDRAQGVAQL
jgi:hypothetical protein